MLIRSKNYNERLRRHVTSHVYDATETADQLAGLIPGLRQTDRWIDKHQNYTATIFCSCTRAKAVTKQVKLTL